MLVYSFWKVSGKTICRGNVSFQTRKPQLPVWFLNSTLQQKLNANLPIKFLFFSSTFVCIVLKQQFIIIVFFSKQNESHQENFISLTSCKPCYLVQFLVQPRGYGSLSLTLSDAKCDPTLRIWFPKCDTTGVTWFAQGLFKPHNTTLGKGGQANVLQLIKKIEGVL